MHWLVALSRFLRQILWAVSMLMSMFVGLCKPIHITSSGNDSWLTLTIRAWNGHGTLNCILQSLMNHGVPGDAIFQAAAHLCSDCHNEHGLSYADVTRQLLGRIAPSSFNREGAYVMHTGTPGNASCHCTSSSRTGTTVGSSCARQVPLALRARLWAPA